jgi:hypothetical protein
VIVKELAHLVAQNEICVKTTAAANVSTALTAVDFHRRLAQSDPAG